MILDCYIPMSFVMLIDFDFYAGEILCSKFSHLFIAY